MVVEPSLEPLDLDFILSFFGVNSLVFLEVGFAAMGMGAVLGTDIGVVVVMVC